MPKISNNVNYHFIYQCICVIKTLSLEKRTKLYTFEINNRKDISFCLCHFHFSSIFLVNTILIKDVFRPTAFHLVIESSSIQQQTEPQFMYSRVKFGSWLKYTAVESVFNNNSFDCSQFLIWILNISNKWQY